MKIYIARHAWAGEAGDPRWPNDAHRPLTPEGVERYQQVVGRLAGRGFAPTRIATSPLRRCVQTAAIIAELVPGNPPVVELEALAPGGGLAPLLEWSAMHPDDAVCWVGHAPDVAWRLAGLIGAAPGGVWFPKGAVAAVDEVDPTELSRGGPPGVLRWLVTAKVLGV